MDGYAADCVRCCADDKDSKHLDSPKPTISNGQTAGLRSKGYTVWNMALANMSSLQKRPTNWKAGCGKSASPVWREGWSSNLHPYPYFIVGDFHTSFSFCFFGAAARRSCDTD